MSRGANVDGVALGLSAFGVMTADGAALGLNALGSTDEAGALGLMEFGPVAAGAEPGIGMKTPWAIVASPRVRAAKAAARANKRLRVGSMTRPTRGCLLPQVALNLSLHSRVEPSRAAQKLVVHSGYAAPLKLRDTAPSCR